MIISTLLKHLLIKLDFLVFKKWNSHPLTKKPIANIEKYYELWEKTKLKDNPEVNQFEKRSGYKIDINWLDELALKTQIVVKKSELNYAHGKVLYSALREYVSNYKRLDNISILETGTARGFSSLCMAKALFDSGIPGSILTFDVLPHKKKIYWKCIEDHKKGPTSREELLKPWEDLVQKYIIFYQGYSDIELKKLGLQRINFAFLDGSHTYKDVFFEFDIIKDQQKKGDVIVFDDYNKELFPGIVKAVDEICDKFGYDKEIIKSFDSRSYVIAKKQK
jgi:predicted O-methyltransferase YrrM